MESKKAVAIVSLLTVLLAFFALVPPASYAKPDIRQGRYYIMGGALEACTQLGIFPATFWITPFQTRPPDLTPLLMTVNVTASDPWFLASNNGWIVNLTIPAAAFVGVYHSWYDNTSELWFNLQHYLPSDGHGWIFLNGTGDVDCYTFNNDTGTYWKSPSPKAGQLAALTGNTPDVGPDGVPGTGDDGFGDGTKDPRGSSIVILPSWLRCEWAKPPFNPTFSELFDIQWPVVFTTGTAYDIVDEPASEIDGANATRSGQPQEFYAGLDGYAPVAWGTPYCDAYIKYACCWSMLNIFTADYGDLDVMFAITYKLMREDCALPDIMGENEYVTISDIRRAAKAYDQYDESWPSKPTADPLFDAGADVQDPRGWVSISDIRRIASYYQKQLTPNGIIQT